MAVQKYIVEVETNRWWPPEASEIFLGVLTTINQQYPGDGNIVRKLHVHKVRQYTKRSK